MELLYPFALVVHIVGVIVAVGSATIVDYLHLVGLKRKKLEVGLVNIYPLISKMINFSLILIYLSGIFLVFLKPELLASPLFRLKMLLVLIVTLNGIYLQRVVSPNLDKCVIKGTKYCTQRVLTTSTISGSVSIVTWYSIVTLSLTKDLAYAPLKFLIVYGLVLIASIIIAYAVEFKAKNWRS